MLGWERILLQMEEAVSLIRRVSGQQEFLELARLCLITNRALLDFMDNRKNKKGLPEMEKALQFLRLFSTKDGSVIEPFTFGKNRKLTTVQIVCSQRYFVGNLRKFRLAIKELSEMLSTKPKKLKGKKEKAWRCIRFFRGLLSKCLWATHYGVN